MMLDQFLKCLALIERTTARQAVAVAGLVFASSILEAFGIGLIFVFINSLVDPLYLEKLAWIGKIVGPAIIDSGNEFMIFLALVLLGTFVSKNVILLGFYYVQARFVNTNEALLATRLLDRYLNGTYVLHLTRNSAEFIRTLTDAIRAVFQTVVMGYINLAAECLLIMALTAVLLLVEPMLTLGAALVLGMAVNVFFYFSKSRFATWGEQEQKITEEILRSLQQGFHSIKEVKILGRQNFVVDSFAVLRRELARILTWIGTMTNAPRLWVETVIVTAVLLVIVFILSSGGDTARIISAVALFAATAFRLIPSMNRIIIALNGIKKGAYAIDLVHDDLFTFQENPDEEIGGSSHMLEFGNVLSVEDVSFNYPGAENSALKKIDLVLRKGESIGLVGPSGSGKTTMVDVILGLLVPTSGRVAVDGTDISDTMRAWRRQIGYVPQSIHIMDDTLRHNVAFGLNDDQIDDTLVENAISLAQLEELVHELPEGLDTRLGERGVRLSGGQRQRVGIARALYRDPEVLVLDEATSSLDNETEQEINNAIERLRGKKTLIIIAHRLSTVRKCNHLVFIKDGRVADTGNFDELASRNQDFNRLVELSKL